MFDEIFFFLGKFIRYVSNTVHTSLKEFFVNLLSLFHCIFWQDSFYVLANFSDLSPYIFWQGFFSQQIYKVCVPIYFDKIFFLGAPLSVDIV